MTNGMYELVIECIGSGNCNLFITQLINLIGIPSVTISSAEKRQLR